MDDDLQGTNSIDPDLNPLSPSFPDDLSLLAQQQAHTGGVGTTTYHDSAASSFVSDACPLTPASTPPASASPYPPSPLTPAALPATPESPPDQDTISPSPSPSPASSSGEYRCDFPGCKTKAAFKLKCKLKKHMNNHTRPHKCPYCTDFQGGAERKDLFRHQRKYHANEPDVQTNKQVSREYLRCPRCDAPPMRADNLKRHLKSCGVPKGG